MRARLQTVLIVFVVAACFGVGFATVARADPAAERAQIDRDVNQALAVLYKKVPGSHDLARRADGILVFPAIYKAGFVVGGQYGQGALRIHGKSVAYYNTAGASFGLQAGAEQHSIAYMFMTQDALHRFEASSGWDVGGDASVTLVNIGANGSIDASRLNKPIVAFVFGESGLMGNLSLKGTKVSKLDLPAAAQSGSSTPK
jgi:lipid-binding SYLF domain-containing protein